MAVLNLLSQFSNFTQIYAFVRMQREKMNIGIIDCCRALVGMAKDYVFIFSSFTGCEWLRYSKNWLRLLSFFIYEVKPINNRGTMSWFRVMFPKILTLKNYLIEFLLQIYFYCGFALNKASSWIMDCWLHHRRRCNCILMLYFCTQKPLTLVTLY